MADAVSLKDYKANKSIDEIKSAFAEWKASCEARMLNDSDMGMRTVQIEKLKKLADLIEGC